MQMIQCVPLLIFLFSSQLCFLLLIVLFFCSMMYNYSLIFLYFEYIVISVFCYSIQELRTVLYPHCYPVR